MLYTTPNGPSNPSIPACPGSRRPSLQPIHSSPLSPKKLKHPNTHKTPLKDKPKTNPDDLDSLASPFDPSKISKAASQYGMEHGPDSPAQHVNRAAGLEKSVSHGEGSEKKVNNNPDISRQISVSDLSLHDPNNPDSQDNKLNFDLTLAKVIISKTDSSDNSYGWLL